MFDGVLVPKVMTQIVNTDPSHQQSQGLTSIPIGRGEMMWVHPDLAKDIQWTTFTSKRKQKTKKNMNWFYGYDTSASLLTDYDDEHIVFMADTTSSTGTRSGKLYL